MMKFIKPMLAYKQEKIPKDRYYEVKLDGARGQLHIHNKKIKLYNRRGKDITYRYPEFKEIPKHLKYNKDLILDGEIVVFQRPGDTSFQKLSYREHLDKPKEIRKRIKKYPAHFVTYDIMRKNGTSLLNKPFEKRRKILKSIFKKKKNKIILHESSKKLAPILDFAKTHDEEGIMSKEPEGKYYPGKRSKTWLKHKFLEMGDFAVIGYLPGTGKRKGQMGSLAIAGRDKKGNLRYIGQVGTGYSDEDINVLTKDLKKIAKNDFSGIVNRNELPSKIIPVKPKFIARTEFLNWTKYGKVRAPVYKGLRTDIPLKEIDRVAGFRLGGRIPQKLGTLWKGEKYIHGPRLRQPSEFTQFRLGKPTNTGTRWVFGKDKKTGKWIRQSKLTPRQHKKRGWFGESKRHSKASSIGWKYRRKKYNKRYNKKYNNSNRR